MTIQLYIKKEVLPYQTLCVSFENQIVPLEQLNGYWTITIPNHPNKKYYYVVCKHSEIIRKERFPHLFPSFSIEEKPKQTTRIEMRDQWNEFIEPYSPHFFDTIVFSRTLQERPKPSSKVSLILRCKWQMIPSNHDIYVVGSNDGFGNWNVEKALKMKPIGSSWWEREIDIENLREIVEYKYFMKKNEIIWEDSNNRILAPLLGSCIGCERAVIYQEDVIKFNISYKSAGVKVCVNGLNGRGCGCGDLYDLIEVIDFCSRSGLSIIELLPINDYSTMYYIPNSLHAIDPALISFRSFNLNRDMKEIIDTTSNELKNDGMIDRKKVIEEKMKILRLIFKMERDKYKSVTAILFNTQKGEDDIGKFVEKNKEWLLPYIIYKTVGSKMMPTMENLKKSLLNHTEECIFHVFIQFNLFSQLKYVIDYAMNKHIGLIGTLSFSVDKHSVDTWINPNYFNVDKDLIDVFNYNKQYGVPYNWNELELDNYRMIKQRLSLFEEYFPIIKFDQIELFFRCYEQEKNGITGCCSPQRMYTKQDLINSGLKDIDRLTYSYVRRHTLEQLFGEDSDYVIEKYLIDNHDGSYNLKASYRSENQINNETGLNDRRPSDKKIIDGLLKLLKNVCLFEIGNQYIPSPSMKTNYSSYNELEDSVKIIMDKLYDDFYYKRNSKIWKQQGKKILSVLCDNECIYIGQSSNEFFTELNELKIVTNEIETYNSLYDSSEYQTIRAFWENNHQRLWYEMGKSGYSPQFLSCDLMKEIMYKKLQYPSMFIIFNMQDIVALKEKYIINKNPHLESWVLDNKLQYQLSMTIDELIGDHELQHLVYDLIHSSGRIMN